MRYVDEPSMSSSSIQVTSQGSRTFKPPAPLPRVKSAADQLITDEEYVLWDTMVTPAEKAAEKALRNRGPPPKLPDPYQKSRSLSRSGVNDAPSSSSSSSKRFYSSSDIESSLQEAPSTKALKPPPRRKFSIHKPKANNQPIT